MDALITWLYNSWASHLVNDYRWSWPIAETLHFIGLTLMAGSVGAFDLRLLGLLKGLRPAELHRLLRFGIGGFALSVGTGLLFIAGAPDQYFYNSAFHLKAICLGLMGLNVVLFYTLEFRTVCLLGPRDSASGRAKLMASVSLTLIVAVMLFGRMLTFFRPVY
jgi:hypothetical protein